MELKKINISSKYIMKLILFDVDGTICEYGQSIQPKMLNIIKKLKHKYDLGIVGGGIYKKLCAQIPNIWDYFSYVCCDNGNVIYKYGIKIYENDIRNKFDTETLTKINERLMNYLANSKKIKIKTGRFINLRKGLIYFVPIGHNCTISDRKEFVEYDKRTNIRIEIINDLKRLFTDIDLSFSIGGELGIAIHPKNWDKSNILNYISLYDKIYFFGDRIHPYGNDYTIANHKNIYKYYNVSNIDETIKILTDYF